MNSKQSHKKKLGFTTPDGYFENAHDQLMQAQKSMVHEDLGFSIPDDYFFELEHSLLKDQKKKNKPVVQSYFWSTLAVAASLAILFTIRSFNSTTTTVDFAMVQDEELVAYVDQSYYWNDPEFIEHAVGDEFINASLEEDLISDDSIIEYLNEEVNYQEIIVQ